MLVKELDVSIIDTFSNLLPYLMRTPPLNHIQGRPAILGFSAGRRAHEKRVFKFALQTILLDVVCEHRWDLSTCEVSHFTCP